MGFKYAHNRTIFHPPEFLEVRLWWGGEEGLGVSSVALGCTGAGRLLRAAAGCETGTKWVWRQATRRIKSINWVWANMESNTLPRRAQHSPTCWEHDMKIAGRSKKVQFCIKLLQWECKWWRLESFETHSFWYKHIVKFLHTLYVKTPRLQISAWGVSGAGEGGER